jgi:hypothetical protein
MPPLGCGGKAAARSVAVLLAAAVLAGPWIAAGGFEFAGFHLGMDLSALRTRYPTSRHELRPLTADIGTFLLRVSPADLVEDVFYVQAEVAQGRIGRLVLRFEIPQELRATRAGPSCDAVRRKLMERYGSPNRVGPGWYEEAVFHWPIVWEDAGETLTWDCGEYAVVIRPR